MRLDIFLNRVPRLPVEAEQREDGENDPYDENNLADFPMLSA